MGLVIAEDSTTSRTGIVKWYGHGREGGGRVGTKDVEGEESTIILRTEGSPWRNAARLQTPADFEGT